MSDQQRERLEALAAENNKLRPENARLKRALEVAQLERNALAHRLSVLNYDDSGYQAVLNRAVEAEAALKVADKVIRDLRSEVARLSAGSTNGAEAGE